MDPEKAAMSSAPQGRLTAVCVGQPRTVVHRDREVKTAIFKRPVEGKVRATPTGLDGDCQVDRRLHGGLDKAIYAYPLEHYDFWAEELGCGEIPFGRFGENLTLEGLGEDRVRIGDILQVGSTRLQITQPRLSCYKIGIALNSGPGFPARFLRAGRLGYYFRVLEAGGVEAGDAVRLEDSDPNAVTVAELIDMSLTGPPDAAAAQRILRSPGLSDNWKRQLRSLV